MTSFSKSNTYEFKINEKRIVLKAAKPKSSLGSHKTRIVTDKKNKKPLHLVTRSQFLKESKEEGIMYVTVPLVSL